MNNILTFLNKKSFEEVTIINSNYTELKNIAQSLGCTVLENEPLKKHTSFKVGGPAKLFIYINNDSSLQTIIEFINKNKIPYFVLGNGTNLLVDDNGYDGVVLSLLESEKILKLEGENTIICSAGLPLTKVCVFALENNLSGLEFAWGIPGSCGGALFMNAGAYGEDISYVVKESKHMTPSGKIEIIPASQMRLSYRKSCYSENSNIILSLKLRLRTSDNLTIRSKMHENMTKRKSKQPLEFPNAGSVFKRPGGGYYAGTLIQDSGLKGVSVGGAMVSPKHAGFIVNTGKATAKDVADLIKIIKETVYKKSGVTLECEIKTLGNITL